LAVWNPFKKKDGEEVTKDGEQTKSEVDQLVEKLGVSFEERIKPLQEGFTALKAEWDGIKAAAEKETPPNNNGGGGDELTDEQKAIRDRQALLVLSVQTNARITESEVLSGISQKWAKFIPGIKKYFAETPVARKSQADYAEYCNNIVKMVIGDAALKSGLGFNQKGDRFFLEDAASKSGGDDSPLNDSDLSWTDPTTGKTLSATDQLARLGIDPEKFVENQKKGYLS
jgi:hypothetical protein